MFGGAEDMCSRCLSPFDAMHHDYIHACVDLHCFWPSGATALPFLFRRPAYFVLPATCNCK